MTSSLNVGVISRSQAVRLAAARAFDHAPPAWTIRLHETPPADADVVVFGADLRHEAGDELVFEPTTPELIVDEIKRRMLISRGRTFVITGAGRGVGVTSAALHLSYLSARDKPTCFVDINVKWDSARRMGVDGEHLTWPGSRTKDQDAGNVEDIATAALPVAGGFRALLPPSQSEPGAVKRVLTSAQADFERVIVDCADSEQLSGALDGAAAGVLIVPFTIPGAYRAVDVLKAHADSRWAIVVNRLGPGGEMTRAAMHRILEHRTAVELPCSPSLRDAEDDARLLTSNWSRYLRGVSRLHTALEGVEA